MGDTRRIVIHFPGFEPLDGEAHRLRYERAAAQSGKAFGFHSEVGTLATVCDVHTFKVQSTGPNWSADATFYLLDGHDGIRRLAADPFIKRFLGGLISAFYGLMQGAYYRYFRISWRFGLLAVYPILFALLGLVAVCGVMLIPTWFDLSPVHFAWSVPLALIFSRFVLMPVLFRSHIMTLFDGFRETVMLATLDDPTMRNDLARYEKAVEAILAKPADEYLMTTHSRGGTIAIYVLGKMLKRDPGLLANKRFTFVTLGGSGLHVALLSNATALREHYRTILSCDDVFWIDYQCLADPINFYHSRPARDLGLKGVREPYLVRIRVKDMVSPARYQKMRLNFLRIHRQFVLGSDRRTRFDFTLLTSGPFDSRAFLQFPATGVPMDATGAVLDRSRSPTPALDL